MILDLAPLLDDAHASAVRAMPPIDLENLAGLRAFVDGLPLSEMPPGVELQELAIPGHLATDPLVHIRTFRRTASSSTGEANNSDSNNIKLPVLLWIHGGGFVFSSAARDDLRCANRVLALDCFVVSVEHRLAPEHPAPAAVHDCYAALKWIHARSDVDTSRIIVGGNSAGGGLAAATVLMARDLHELDIKAQLLACPMLDYRNSCDRIQDSRVWNLNSNRIAWDYYLAGNEVTPYASPATATDLSGLPPAYINVNSYDLFLDEDIAYSQALLRAGVSVELHVYPGGFHLSNLYVDSPLSQRWLVDEDDFLARMWKS